jgi:hypothetical protein
MDQNQLASFIKNLNTSPDSLAKVEGLLRKSAESLQLLKKMQGAAPEDRENVREEFLNAQKEISSDYEKMLGDMGLSREALEQFASDPKNFSPESWEFLQSFKKEVSSQTKLEEKKPEAKPKKSKLKTKQQWVSA